MKTYLHIFICFLLHSCYSGTPDKFLVIPVDVAQDVQVNLSEIADDIKKIELETTKDILLDEIRQVLYYNDLIFILDNRVHAFDSDGRFLFHIGTAGKGPGEYMYPSCMALDTINRFVYLNSLTKIIKYGFDGHFIDESSVIPHCEYICFLNDQLCVLSSELGKIDNGVYKNTVTLFRVDKDWKIKDSIVVKKWDLHQMTGAIGPNAHYLSQDLDHNLYFYYPILVKELPSPDTLYYLNGNNLEPYAKLKFNDKGAMEKSKYIFNIYRTSKYIIAEYLLLPSDKFYFCYNIENGLGTNMKNGFVDDIYNTGTTGIHLLEGEFFYYTKISDKKNSSFITEPNPVLYIGKFK